VTSLGDAGVLPELEDLVEPRTLADQPIAPVGGAPVRTGPVPLIIGGPLHEPPPHVPEDTGPASGDAAPMGLEPDLYPHGQPDTGYGQ